jgi:hypothetical protein
MVTPTEQLTYNEAKLFKLILMIDYLHLHQTECYELLAKIVSSPYTSQENQNGNRYQLDKSDPQHHSYRCRKLILNLNHSVMLFYQDYIQYESKQ